MIETDLVSVFALTQSVGAAMIAAGRGSVINSASLGAERALDRYPLVAYNAAKAGVVAMTRSLAALFDPARIGRIMAAANSTIGSLTSDSMPG